MSQKDKWTLDITQTTLNDAKNTTPTVFDELCALAKQTIILGGTVCILDDEPIQFRLTTLDEFVSFSQAINTIEP